LGETICGRIRAIYWSGIFLPPIGFHLAGKMLQ
jgi:hypothetical protein